MARVTLRAIRASRGLRYDMRQRASCSSRRSTVLGQVMLPRRSPRRRRPAVRRAPWSPARRARAAASDAGVGSQTRPVSPSRTSSAGPPLSRHVMTALRGGEGLDGDQAVVFLEGREDHRAARGEARHEGVRVHGAEQRHARLEAVVADQLPDARRLLAVARNRAAHAALPPARRARGRAGRCA